MSGLPKNNETATFLADTWSKNAAADPFYAVLSHENKQGGGWNKDEFFETGQSEVAEIAKLLSQRGLSLGGPRALDFGCGLGRLTQALAQYFDEVVGVDISPVMLERANSLNRHGNVSYVLNATPDLGQFTDSSFDFILSRIVLQHTGRALARSYLSEFGRILRPGGLADIQVPVGFKNLSGLLGVIVPRGIQERYQVRKKGVFFTSTAPIRSTEVVRIVGRRDCRVLDIRSVDVNRALRIQSFLFTKSLGGLQRPTVGAPG